MWLISWLFGPVMRQVWLSLRAKVKEAEVAYKAKVEALDAQHEENVKHLEARLKEDKDNGLKDEVEKLIKL